MTPVWVDIEAHAPGELPHPIAVVEEVPVGILYAGVPYAVMMASPADLEDFALGFSLTEGVVRHPDEVRTISQREAGDGIELDLTISGERLHEFLARRRVRSLRGHTSCGLCGVEDIAGVCTPVPAAPAGVAFTPAAIRRALAGLQGRQVLHERTRAAHAAALVDAEGGIQLLREDVGRHNALDKLVGAALHAGVPTDSGFCLITSRCSYEMVQKALAAGMAAIVAICAPTALAVRRAEQAGLTLVARARAGGCIIYAGPQRVIISAAGVGVSAVPDASAVPFAPPPRVRAAGANGLLNASAAPPSFPG